MPGPVFEFVVAAELSGLRIDTFLTKHLRNYNSWRLQRIVGAGAATVNDAPAGQTDRVFAGQRVRIELLEPPDKLLDVCLRPVPILYEDPWLVVVNKPAGMISHPVGEQQGDSLANVLQHVANQRGPARGILRPGLMHRLDRQTSGAMVVALTHDAHVALAAAFEASRVAKSYLTLVEGRIERTTGTMNRPIGRTPTGRHVLMSCRADALERRAALTHYQVLQRFERHTLVLARPRTGRNHQIRVHFAALGHPLVGDEFYEANHRIKPFYEDRDPDDPREVETGLPIRRHALHALTLEFAHPITGLWMTVHAPLPEDFQRTLDVLRDRQLAAPEQRVSS